MLLREPDPLLWAAIANRRTVQLIYHGKQRLLEPHDYGILNGSAQLLGYQFSGQSSRPLPNWILMKTDEITGLELLNRTFPGGRPTVSGKHRGWDKLFIRVKPAADWTQMGPVSPPSS